MSTSSLVSTEGMKLDYKDHSETQLASIQSSSIYIEEAVRVFDVESMNLLMICDYGCSHGSNSIHAIQSIIQTLKRLNKIDENRQTILAIHTDLPTNNWTSLFNSFPNDKNYFGVAVGKSFYDQCLPKNTVAFGYSSSALHWLSSKPCNLTDRCLVDPIRNDSETFAFRKQAQLDYIRFLQHRAEELLIGGVLVLSIFGDQSGKDTHNHADLLYQCAKNLLSIDELIEFTFPIYFRTYDECIDRTILTSCGFELIKSDWVAVQSPLVEQFKQKKITLDHFAHLQTKAVRSACEFPLKQSLTINGKRTDEEINEILQKYWSLHEDGIKERPEMMEEELMCINVVLKKSKIVK